MIILAHRGWWVAPDERNSPTAILRAFAAGYGVETDVRDHNGALVLAHDPPTGDAQIPFDWVLESFARAGQPGALAINIKADGLHSRLIEMIARYQIDKAFVFDMAVPDSLGYLSRSMPAFTRHSEIEPVPSFYDQAAGIWLDCFEGEWFDDSVIHGHLAAGKKVALVSPELHGRSPSALWARLRRMPDTPFLMLCTDFPAEWESGGVPELPAR